MIVFAKESKANIIFANYKNAAAFNLGTKKNSNDDIIMINYQSITCLPDDDTINAVISGDIKASKIIKKACKKLVQGPTNDNSGLCVGMIQMITMLTGSHKSKKGDPILVFVYEDEMTEDQTKRIKFLIKYLKALFKMFGIEKFYGNDDVNKIFAKKKKYRDGKIGCNKARKAAIEAVIDANKSKGNHISAKGAELQKQLKVCYDIELRHSAMFNVDPKYLKINTEALIKSLVAQYTTVNVNSINSKKVAKKLAKKDKLEVKAYMSLRDMLLAVDPELKLPKVKYGQHKSKKGTAKGPKMDIKKFVKFFDKKKNRALLPIIYAHTALCVLGYEIGSSKYNKNMSDTMSAVFDSDVSKAFVGVAKDIYKDTKAKAEADKTASK